MQNVKSVAVNIMLKSTLIIPSNSLCICVNAQRIILHEMCIQLVTVICLDNYCSHFDHILKIGTKMT